MTGPWTTDWETLYKKVVKMLNGCLFLRCFSDNIPRWVQIGYVVEKNSSHSIMSKYLAVETLKMSKNFHKILDKAKLIK